MARARVIGPIRSDRAEFHISGDLVKEFGQHGRVTDVAVGDLDGSDLQRVFVDANVDLAPQTTFRTPMLAGMPLPSPSALMSVLSISRFRGAASHGMVTERVFGRLLRVLKSGTDQSRPTSH